MSPSHVSFKRIALITASVLGLLYAVAGFFVLPRILAPRLREEIASRTGTEVTLGALRVNPFALSVTIEDFSIAGLGGESFFAMKRLYVNFEVRSIFTGAATFSEIAIDSPAVHVRLRADGTTNIPPFTAADTAGSAAAAEGPSSALFVVVDRFVLARGRAVYEDRSRATPRTMRFDSLNLTLNDFTTRPREKGEYAFDASTDRNERLSWHGTIQAAPFVSAGSIAVSGMKARTLWEFMQDRLNYELTDGELSMQARYSLDLSGRTARFTLTDGEAHARAVRLIDNATRSEQVLVRSADVAGISLDYATKTVRIASVTGTGALIRTTRDTAGAFGVTSLMMMKPDPVPAKDAPWKISLDRIDVQECTVRIADLNTVPATEIVVTPLGLTIEHYAVLSAVPASLVVTGRLEPAGSFTVKGVFTDNPVTSDIALECAGVHLPSFQRFVDMSATLTIASGALSVKGRVKYADRAPVPSMTFIGSASVSGFRAVDPLVNEDFLRWQLLEVNRIAFSRTPASLDVSEIVARRAYIRFVIDSTRTTNIQKIMAVGGTDSAAHAKAPGANAPPPAAEPSAPTRIGIVRVVDGSMNFADYSLLPNFATGIQEMNGTIIGLNSAQLTHAEVSVDGRVDRYAPVEIRGQINPLSEQAYTDIAMKFHSIELTTFTPYFGKFAGYKIDKGKLSLDLHYKLNKKFLEAENNIVIDQLTLGEKVDGPDVTSLPVRLAIALLRDSKGVIDLDLPVKGSLDDPEFSVFPIVVKVLVNLLTKAVTAPFKLLGSLLGGNDEDLSYVQFAPGVDTLDTAEQTKLASLAKALTERPALRLDVRGLASDSLDRSAMAASTLLRLVRARGGRGPVLDEADNGRILRLFSERFGADPDSLLPPERTAAADAPTRETRAAEIVRLARMRLIASLQPGDDELLALARRRAVDVKDRLVVRSGIEEGRIFLLDFQKGAKEADGAVQMPLSLDAR